MQIVFDCGLQDDSHTIVLLQGYETMGCLARDAQIWSVQQLTYH